MPNEIKVLYGHVLTPIKSSDEWTSITSQQPLKHGERVLVYDSSTNELSERIGDGQTTFANLPEIILLYKPDIPNGNLIKWDAETKKFVDAGGSLGDISTALDELHTYAQNLVSGGES